MDQNKIKNRFGSVHLPINRCLWRFCGLLPSFLWLCVGSSKFFARPLKRIALVSSLPEVPCSPPKFCVKNLSTYSPPKKSSHMLGFSCLFIRQPIPYGISYFLLGDVRGYGKVHACGSHWRLP